MTFTLCNERGTHTNCIPLRYVRVREWKCLIVKQHVCIDTSSQLKVLLGESEIAKRCEMLLASSSITKKNVWRESAPQQMNSEGLYNRGVFFLDGEKKNLKWIRRKRGKWPIGDARSAGPAPPPVSFDPPCALATVASGEASSPYTTVKKKRLF